MMSALSTRAAYFSPLPVGPIAARRGKAGWREKKAQLDTNHKLAPNNRRNPLAALTSRVAVGAKAAWKRAGARCLADRRNGGARAIPPPECRSRCKRLAAMSHRPPLVFKRRA